MDLLLEIKKFLELTMKYSDKGVISLERIEQTAEEVYKGNWKSLTDEIKIGYSNEAIQELIEQLDKIKEIVANEKNN